MTEPLRIFGGLLALSLTGCTPTEPPRERPAPAAPAARSPVEVEPTAEPTDVPTAEPPDELSASCRRQPATMPASLKYESSAARQVCAELVEPCVFEDLYPVDAALCLVQAHATREYPEEEFSATVVLKTDKDGTLVWLFTWYRPVTETRDGLTLWSKVEARTGTYRPVRFSLGESPGFL